MKEFWFITYNFLFLPIFWAVTRLLSLFNKKIREGYKQRKHLFLELKEKSGELDSTKKNILIHCSSLGEFEQAKPILDQLDKMNKYNFIISFFSPSGFNYSKLDSTLQSKILKTYLPFDWFHNSNKFIDIIKPDTVIFIKYDLWFNLLYILRLKSAFTMLVNASRNVSSFKWKFFPTRSYLKTVYRFLDVISCVNEDDKSKYKALLNGTVDIENFGDTKYERIYKAKEISMTKSLLNNDILADKNVFVIGSSQDRDNEILFPVLDKISSHSNGFQNNLISILAPHEPTEDNLEQIEDCIQKNYPHLKTIRYSSLKNFKNENIILIDCIGILMTMYKYADVAYVGGGLHSGLHNVLEPAGYGIPVLFGGEKISDDAKLLINKGGGLLVNNIKSLYKRLTKLLNKEEEREKIGLKSFSVFETKYEASNKIASLINNVSIKQE